MKSFIESAGWLGMAGILVSYALLSFGFLIATSATYQAINLLAASGVAAVSFYDRAWQPGVLNAIWALIALVALVRILLA
jgi:hypothetical protein